MLVKDCQTKDTEKVVSGLIKSTKECAERALQKSPHLGSRPKNSLDQPRLTMASTPDVYFCESLIGPLSAMRSNRLCQGNAWQRGSNGKNQTGLLRQ